MLNNIQILDCSSELGNCCGDSSLAILFNTLGNIISILQLIVPILLMIFATVEFIKLVINPETKNGLGRVRNSFFAAAVVFFIPVLVDGVLYMMPKSYDMTACWMTAKKVAESSVEYDFQNVVVDDEERTPLLSDPEKYEKGVPKSNDTSSSDNSVKVSAGDVKGILEGAEKVHTMYEQDGWAYYNDLSQLVWNDIKTSTNNPYKKTCCATFVGSALYVGGVFSESEVNKYNYNSQYGISDLCEAHGWTRITNYNQLAAGDVVLMSGPSGGSSVEHTQIYAGNGTWYNAGSNNAISRDNPYESDASGRFLYAWRKPA